MVDMGALKHNRLAPPLMNRPNLEDLGMTVCRSIRRRAASPRLIGLLLLVGLLLAGTASADSAPGVQGSARGGLSDGSAPIPSDPDSWSIDHHAPVHSVDMRSGAVELILDDGSREADVGFGDTEAFQFLWFNQFERPPSLAIDLMEIQVLFPPGPEMAPGNAIQLVVYVDPDGDPSNGAELRAAFDDEIQVVDGVSFSVYPLPEPVRIVGAGDVLIGVVNRFVDNGVSPPSRPAALDTTTSQGRSWVALWTDVPPDDPELPPDLFLDTVDFLEPGNWMIRGFATTVPIVDVPALGPVGLAALATLIALAGGLSLRRRRNRGS